MDDLLYCVGCGSKIQTIDKKAIGYIPKAALDKQLESDKDIYCQRCFRLRHYNEIIPTSLTNEDFLNVLSEIKNKHSLVVYLIDIFDFNGSLIPNLRNLIGENDLLLVANKIDVLPHSIKLKRIVDWLQNTAQIKQLNPIDIALISAKKSTNISHLMNLLEKYRQGNDVYIIGTTNVGKSTLINQIIQKSSGLSSVITVSKFPGTTLDNIKIPLNNGHYLIDTPGIIQSGQIAHKLQPEELKYAIPQKEIKPKTYQLNEGQTLFVGGLVRLDIVKKDTDNRVGITSYFENNLYLHRTKTINANNIYQKHVGELLKPPTNKVDFDLVAHKFITKEKSDLVIEGLGWFTLPKGIQATVWSFPGVNVLIRTALI